MSATLPGSVPRLELELTSACDHACSHCYNVWNAKQGEPQGGYPRGQLSTPETLAMHAKAFRESSATQATLTGGEPLLRKDFSAIARNLRDLGLKLHIITNGGHVTEERAAELADVGFRSVQLTLLSADRATHDRLKGTPCFDETLRAAVALKERGVHVQVCFVATRETAPGLARVLELCYALGVRGVSYNRMAPAGGGVRFLDLLPTPDQIRDNLETAERLGRAWGIRVGTAMPIPPCVVRTDHLRWVRAGMCSTGSASPNLVVDPLGNVRSCNLSSTVLGNVREQHFSTILAHPHLRGFRLMLPELCQGCVHARSCQGGCKESAFACGGSYEAADPLVARAAS
jgi:radical SAM protein with 4Fe4S-binding SPASM domain